MARAHLRRLSRPARELLGPFSPSALESLGREVVALPGIHEAIVEALVGSPAPQIPRLIEAALRRPEEDGPGFVATVLRRHDLSVARAALGRAVVALREQGAIDDYLAAAAFVDLEGPRSNLLASAVTTAVHRRRVALEQGAQPHRRDHRHPAPA